MSVLKRTLVIILIIYVVMSVFHVIYRLYGDRNYELFIYRVGKSFRQYKSDFDTLAKVFSERFEDDFNRDDNLSSVYVDYTEDTLYYEYTYIDGSLSNWLDEPIDEDIAACFSSIFENVFTRHSDNPINFTHICVSKE